MRFASGLAFRRSATILLGSSNLLLARNSVANSISLPARFSLSSHQYSSLINFCPVKERTGSQKPFHISSSLQKQQQQQQKRKMGNDASRPDGANLPKGKSESEWRTILSPAQFKILREAGTERAFTHEYETNDKTGIYNCAACDTPLYQSATKFKSGCGWPAFFDAIPGAVKRNVDKSLGMKRIEIRCAACDSHLGHVFEGEGFPTPTDERHCVNGISLRFNDEKEGKI